MKWLNLNAFIICLAAITNAQEASLAEKLGYPAGAKLLIVHADDAGVSHSTNRAVIVGFEEQKINSTSIMVPCPWFPEIAEYAVNHPEYDFGLHLTYTSEWNTYKWAGISPSTEIQSLLNEQGYFYATTEEAVKHAKAKEVETEMRAQIEKAIAAGIHPSHFDSHMLPHFGNLEVFKVYLNLGIEYKTPVLIPENYLALADSFRIPELQNHVIIDHIYEASPDIAPSDWNTYYTDILNNLLPGVSELIFHLAYDNEETRAMTKGHDYYEVKWRQRDIDYIMSKEFQQAIQKNNIQLITWKDIKNVLYPE